MAGIVTVAGEASAGPLSSPCLGGPSCYRTEVVELQVFVTNARARKLYESVASRSWGILPRAIKRQERYLDLEYMVLDLGSISCGSSPAGKQETSTR